MTTSKVFYASEEGKLKVNINFFWDDFSKELMAQYHITNEEIGLYDPLTKELIQDYIGKNFALKINDSIPLDLSLLELINVEDNVIQIQLSTKIIRGTFIKSLQMTNLLLIDAFPNEQVNITHINFDSQTDKHILRFSSEEGIQTLITAYQCK